LPLVAYLRLWSLSRYHSESSTDFPNSGVPVVQSTVEEEPSKKAEVSPTAGQKRPREEEAKAGENGVENGAHPAKKVDVKEG